MASTQSEVSGEKQSMVSEERAREILKRTLLRREKAKEAVRVFSDPDNPVSVFASSARPNSGKKHNPEGLLEVHARTLDLAVGSFKKSLLRLGTKPK